MEFKLVGFLGQWKIFGKQKWSRYVENIRISPEYFLLSLNQGEFWKVKKVILLSSFL